MKFFIPTSLPFTFLLKPNDGGQVPFSLEKTLSNGDPSVRFPEGEHQINVTSTDTKTYKIIADGTPPKTTITLSNAPMFKKNSVTYYGKKFQITLAPKDGLSGVKSTFVSLNEPSKLTDKMVYLFPNDGTFDFSSYACDQVGNTEVPSSLHFIVDVTPPVSSVNIFGKFTEKTLGAGAQIALTSNDHSSGVANIYVSIDGGTDLAYTSPLNLETIHPGTHKLKYYGVDNVQNKELIQVFDFSYDPVPPKLTLIYKGPHYSEAETSYISGTTDLYFETSDNQSKSVDVLCQEEKSVSCKDKFPLLKNEGEHKLILVAKDAVNNETRVEERIYIDTLPPEIKYEIKGQFFWNQDVAQVHLGTKIAIEATDKGAGVKEIRTCSSDNNCSLDKEYKEYKDELLLAKVGEYHFQFFASDRVDNKSKIVSLKLNVLPESKEGDSHKSFDIKKTWVSRQPYGTIAPKAKTFRLQIADSPSDKANIYMLKSHDEISGRSNISFAFDDAPLKTYESPFLVQNDGKPHKLKFFGTDLVGFSSPVHSSVFRVETQAPSSKFAIEPAHYVIASKLFMLPSGKIRLIGNDKSKVKDIFYRIDSGNFIRYQEPLHFTTDVEFMLTYYAVDRVGNPELPHQYQVLFDHTKPHIEVEFSGAQKDPNQLLKGSILGISAVDSQSGVKQIFYRINDLQKQLYRGPILLNEPGHFKIDVFASDWLGNEEKLTLNYQVQK